MSCDTRDAGLPIEKSEHHQYFSNILLVHLGGLVGRPEKAALTSASFIGWLGHPQPWLSFALHGGRKAKMFVGQTRSSFFTISLKIVVEGYGWLNHSMGLSSLSSLGSLSNVTKLAAI